MAAVGGIVLIVSPDGISAGIKKHMRLICSLCMLCVMISPVKSLIGSMGDISDSIYESEDEQLYDIYESIYEEKSDEIYGTGIGEAVKEQLRDKFNIPSSECRVSVEFSDSDRDGFREPKRITVFLTGVSAVNTSRQIESLISEKFGCDCVCMTE